MTNEPATAEQRQILVVDDEEHLTDLLSTSLRFHGFEVAIAGPIHMFASDGGAGSIASITLDDFTQGGSDSVVTMFGLWGMEQFVIGLIGVVMLWRYPALIPVMALAYVIEYIGRFRAPLFTPGVVTEHEPPGLVIDYVLVPLALIMLGSRCGDRRRRHVLSPTQSTDEGPRPLDRVRTPAAEAGVGAKLGALIVRDRSLRFAPVPRSDRMGAAMAPRLAPRSAPDP